MEGKQKIRVLVVEDSLPDAEVCLEELQRAGFELFADVVSTREEFTPRLDAGSYDVILADYRLVGWTAMDALAEVQQRGKDIPFLLVTGSLGEEAAVECLKQGVSDYVLKDRLARLPLAVRRALEEKTQRGERARAEQALRKANEKLALSLEEAQRRRREAIRVSEMAELLQSCQATTEAYQVIGQTVPELFPDDSGALFLLCAPLNLVEAITVWGKFPPSELVFAPDECWAFRRGRLHRVDGLPVGQVCQHLGSVPAGPYVCVPLQAQGETLGVLHVQHSAVSADNLGDSGQSLTEAKQQLAITVAEHIALALANLRLRETLRHLSMRDPLTGLFNRRYMEESLARELHRAIRKQRPLGVILADVDSFKECNDTYGHEAGDALLRELGRFLQEHTRQEDIPCRYGGEEFVLILPEAALEVTRHRAEELRGKVKHLQVHYRGHAFGTITLSLGVAAYPEHGSTANALLRAADVVLYHAKAGGRDRVVVGPVRGDKSSLPPQHASQGQ